VSTLSKIIFVNTPAPAFAFTNSGTSKTSFKILTSLFLFVES
jgi:hypothetical protein